MQFLSSDAIQNPSSWWIIKSTYLVCLGWHLVNYLIQIFDEARYRLEKKILSPDNLPLYSVLCLLIMAANFYHLITGSIIYYNEENSP